jgi:hypothetical protein
MSNAKIELPDIPEPAIILPDGIAVWQTEDKFFILKGENVLVDFDNKHLPDLVDALIELQNI